MRIIQLTLKHNHAFKDKIVGLNNDVSVLYNKENSMGKTTLMRAILYSLGFSIPDTELIKFNDFEFALKITNNNKTYNITRRKQLLTIDECEYDLPTEITNAHAYLFGTENNEMLANLLGSIYFDQEKGWTLLNRGTIIGENRFNIESFFRGLKGDTSDDSYKIVTRINALDKKIAQYKLMLNVSEYQESINRDVEQKLDYKTYEQKLDEEILAKKHNLDKIENEIKLMTDVIKKNKDFSTYIATKKLFVKNPTGGEPIRVTSDTLLDFNDVQDVNIARKNTLIAERSRLKKEIAEREQAQEKEITFLDLPTVDDDLTHKFSTMRSFSSIQVKSMLDKFMKEKNDLKETLKTRTKQNNSWIADAYKIIGDYANELKIPFDYKIDIFTSNLKAKSGAILYKMVFMYKAAYIKLLSQKIGYPLPIFCDSPYGREVTKETVEEVLGVLKRDFSKHQVIIASIYDYKAIYPQANIITMDGTLFNEQTFFD
jgi:hypothetical protein